jgi:predicted nucleic acid-binding protein
MLVADTSALVSLETAAILDLLLDEYDVHTTETVCEELAATSEYDDRHGVAASSVLDRRKGFTEHAVEEPVTTSRIDAGEGSCVVLVRRLEADFLLTDDLRALPEIERAVDAQVAISPIVLRALVTRGVIDRETAVERLETLAERRSWLGTPIYRRANELFEDD